MPEGWEWELTDRGLQDIRSLDDYAQERIVTKLDAIVADEWREPSDYLEPLAGAPHQKLTIGPFRLGARVDRHRQILFIHRIAKRGGDAYRGDDD